MDAGLSNRNARFYLIEIQILLDKPAGLLDKPAFLSNRNAGLLDKPADLSNINAVLLDKITLSCLSNRNAVLSNRI